MLYAQEKCHLVSGDKKPILNLDICTIAIGSLLFRLTVIIAENVIIGRAKQKVGCQVLEVFESSSSTSNLA